MEKNRVDYLSDNLVHLRGKLKHVDEVIPPESLTVSENNTTISTPVKPVAEAKTPAADGKDQAVERRLEQTRQLYSDLTARLARRQAQTAARLQQLQSEIGTIDLLSADTEALRKRLLNCDPEDLSGNDMLKIGDTYRAIDRERLNFFEIEARLETLLNTSAPASAPVSAAPEEPSFKSLLRNGLALALTLGVSIIIGLAIAALIVFAAWR